MFYTDPLNIKTLLEELYSVSDWNCLGTLLNVREGLLNDIKASKPFGKEGLIQMLQAWLNAGEANYDELVKALHVMGWTKQAETIAKKHGKYNILYIAIIICL